MDIKQITIFFGMALLMLGMVSAANVAPTLVSKDNPTCKQLGYDHELKIDSPVVSGTYGSITFTLDTDKKYFDWSSTTRVDAVIAKGGNNANVYYYNSGSLGDNDLVSPLNNGGNVPTLSHATFCWNNGGGCTGPDCGGNGVPEFSTMTLGVAMILTTLGIVFLRKRE